MSSGSESRRDRYVETILGRSAMKLNAHVTDSNDCLPASWGDSADDAMLQMSSRTDVLLSTGESFENCGVTRSILNSIR